MKHLCIECRTKATQTQLVTIRVKGEPYQGVAAIWGERVCKRCWIRFEYAEFFKTTEPAWKPQLT